MLATLRANLIEQTLSGEASLIAVIDKIQRPLAHLGNFINYNFQMRLDVTVPMKDGEWSARSQQFESVCMSSLTCRCYPISISKIWLAKEDLDW